jgi:adenylate kinase family enzyme
MGKFNLFFQELFTKRAPALLSGIISASGTNMIEAAKQKYLLLKAEAIEKGEEFTITQGEFLDKITDVELVIYLEVSDETIQKRILERGKTSGREDDQSVDIIQRRIKQFKEETFPLIDFYKAKKVLTYVDGEGSIDEVFDMVENILRIWS